MMMDHEKSTIKGGSLGHKLDRQYRETANEILSKKPITGALTDQDKEEKLLLHSKDGTSTTHYVSHIIYTASMKVVHITFLKNKKAIGELYRQRPIWLCVSRT